MMKCCIIWDQERHSTVANMPSGAENDKYCHELRQKQKENGVGGISQLRTLNLTVTKETNVSEQKQKLDRKGVKWKGITTRSGQGITTRSGQRITTRSGQGITTRSGQSKVWCEYKACETGELVSYPGDAVWCIQILCEVWELVSYPGDAVWHYPLLSV